MDAVIGGGGWAKIERVNAGLERGGGCWAKIGRVDAELDCRLRSKEGAVLDAGREADARW